MIALLKQIHCFHKLYKVRLAPTMSSTALLILSKVCNFDIEKQHRHLDRCQDRWVLIYVKCFSSDVSVTRTDKFHRNILSVTTKRGRDSAWAHEILHTVQTDRQTDSFIHYFEGPPPKPRWSPRFRNISTVVCSNIIICDKLVLLVLKSGRVAVSLF